MDRLTLTPEERKAVMDRLEGLRYERGRFEVMVELAKVTVEAVGVMELEGYREDDYYTGTGGWVETGRCGSVELTAWTEDGKAHGVDRETEDRAWALLNAE